MTAIIVVAIVAIILLVIAHVSVGVFIMYSESGFEAWTRIGFKSVKVYPAAPRKKTAKPAKEKPKRHTDEKPSKKGGGLEVMRQYAGFAKEAGVDLLHMFRVGWLRVDFTAAAGNAADASILYGCAWAVAGIISAYLENNNNVEKYAYYINLDYAIFKPHIYLEADISVSIGRIVRFAAKYGIRFLRQHLSSKRKGRATVGQANS